MKLEAVFNIEDFGFTRIKDKSNTHEILLGNFGYQAYEFLEFGGGMYVIEVIAILSNNNKNDILTFEVPETNFQFIEGVMGDLENMRNKHEANELVSLLNSVYRSALIDEALQDL